MGACILVLNCCKGEKTAFHTSSLILTDAKKPPQSDLLMWFSQVQVEGSS